VIAGRENVREQREIFYLGERLIPVRELEQVEVSVGDHHIFGLAAHPAAHVDITVGRSRARWIHIQANAGLAFLAIGATSAGDVERHAANIPLLDELDIAAQLDHFTGDLVAENQPRLGGGASADHVLVGAADVGADNFKNDAMLTLPFLLGQLELGVIDVFNFDLARSHVGDAAIASHKSSSVFLGLGSKRA
jgi:hypothetical protein